MKKTLLLLTLTLTASMADNQVNTVNTQMKVLTNDTVVVREVRTYREARCPRAVRQNRQNRTTRVNVEKMARASRNERVVRVAQYMVQKPITHLACSK